MPKDNYTKVLEISKGAALLSSIHNLLDWDQETKMPKEGISVRSQQIELVASLLHKQKTSPRFVKALSKLIDIASGEIIDAALPSAHKAAARAWRRDYLQAEKLPASFVKTFARTTSTAMHVWAEAKKHNDFRAFSPHLEKIVSLCRKKADLLGYKEHPYDALIDLYEPDMRTTLIAPLFARLKTSLTTLMREIGKRPLSPPPLFFQSCDPNKQLKFGHDILHAMGFDKKSSRLDESVHPFCCGLHPKDVRMTTRLESDSLMSNIFSVLHEGGHALYNQGLPESEFGSPLGEQISLGIDESQSRWWETLIGHSLPFWTHFYPRLQKLFPDNLGAVSLDDFYRAINRVHPSFIRVDADEVTYSLHIILRFELEKALIEGSLPVKEVPDAWNAKMKEYLGITPHTLSEGCLQDIHWSSGGIGYFPTYTLGNLYAAQFFTAFEKAHPRWKEQLAHGELGFIAAWLKENIHRHGREFTSTELVERVTKLPLSEAPFINYLTTKYLP